MRTIRKKRDFHEVLREGKTRRYQGFTVKYLAGGIEAATFGFSLPKKFGGSVLRNRARRRIKEAVRLHLGEFPPGKYLFVAGKPALEGEFKELEKELVSFCEAVRDETG